MNVKEAWALIKKLEVEDMNGQKDTLDWVYRSHCKVVDKFIKDNFKEQEEFKIHDKQMTIDDL